MIISFIPFASWLHMFRLHFEKASTGRTIKCYQNGSFFIDLQPPLKWISISHSDSNSLRSIQINLFFFSFFEILFHSIHATAFYLFYDWPKKCICFFCCTNSLVERFPTWFLVFVQFWFICSMIHSFFHSIWSFDYGEWNMGHTRNRCDNHAKHKKLA